MRLLAMPSRNPFEHAKMDLRDYLEVLKHISVTLAGSDGEDSHLSELADISQKIYVSSWELYSACIEFHTLEHYDEWKPVFQELQGTVATVQRYVREFKVSPVGNK
jgi:hypothetical protein